MSGPPLPVECYAGHRGEESPRAFVTGAGRVTVTAILDRWLAPDHRYFKVLGDDGHEYVLRHDVRSDRWDLAADRR